MKKLKVTWQDGPWRHDGQQPVASALIAADARLASVGEDTLVFKDGGQLSSKILLAIPGGRLVSAVEVDESDANNG